MATSTLSALRHIGSQPNTAGTRKTEGQETKELPFSAETESDLFCTKCIETREILTDTLRINSELGVAAALEAQRLSEKYNKDYFNCDDLVLVTGLGKNNVRNLLNSHDFPTITVGGRKVVSVIAFALWSVRSNDIDE